VRPTRRQIEAKSIEIEVEKLLGERDRRRDRASAFDSEEVGGLLDSIGQTFGRQMLADHPPPPGSPLGAMAEVNAIVLAHARASRSDWRVDGPAGPAADWQRVMASHPEAGSLRLRCNGQTWLLDLRGIEYAAGEVHRSELTDSGYVPRPEVVAAAAAAALSAPDGPEALPSSPTFYGSPDGGDPSTTPPPVTSTRPAAVKRTRRGVRRGRAS